MYFNDVIDFWFREIDPKQWWKKDDKFDRTIKERFSDVHARATACELYAWRRKPLGRLAEIIVLDQFSRNIYRGMSPCFASDALALCLAQEAVNVGADRELSVDERSFCYMPFMHSESRLIHQVAVELFTSLNLESSLRYELRHKEIIDRFGRYPHRNEILGRPSTPEEVAFLKQRGSGF